MLAARVRYLQQQLPTVNAAAPQRQRPQQPAPLNGLPRQQETHDFLQAFARMARERT